MQIQIHGKPSFSKGAKKSREQRAQVVIVVGEGRNRRSVTRHIRLVGSNWVGLNPDERAIPLNERYEKELAEANFKLSVAKATLTRLKGDLARIENETPENIVDAAMRKEMVAELKTAIEAAQDDFIVTTKVACDAESKLDIVRRDLPLEVAFVGAGLN